MAVVEGFFEEQTTPSKVKADIVAKYFSAWANVLASTSINQMVYLDLFSGQGRYDDGSPSTPLLVTENAINHTNKNVHGKLQLIFNDAKLGYVNKLNIELDRIPDLKKLYYKPIIHNLTVDDKIIGKIENPKTVPTLSFIDPWGYIGLSLPLIRSLVKNWGCDCIFFFNYRRINPGIENPLLDKPISCLFTKPVITRLRRKLENCDPKTREKIIIAEIENVFNEWGMKYVIPFPFKSNSGNRTIHYLIFVTKHIRGYDIMKNILAKASSSACQGVPSFEYNPCSEKSVNLPLFEMDKPIDDLKESLLSDFVGKKITMRDIYKLHNIGTPYIEKNYRDALLELERERIIITNRNERKTRKNYFPKDMIVCFPDGRSQ